MNENVTEKESGLELKMQDLLMAYLRRWKVLTVCVILGIALAVGYTSLFITPVYRAEATIYVNNNRVTGEQDYITNTDLSAALQLVKGYLVLSKSDIVLEKAADKLGGEYTAAQLRGMISTEQLDNTVIFALRVVHPNPQKAADVANALAEVIPEVGASTLRGSSAEVIDRAKVPSGIYSPSYSTNALMGAAGGLLLAVIYVTIIFLKDTRVKDENDLTDMFRLPILGRVPDLDEEYSGSEKSDSEDKE